MGYVWGVRTENQVPLLKGPYSFPNVRKRRSKLVHFSDSHSTTAACQSVVARAYFGTAA